MQSGKGSEFLRNTLDMSTIAQDQVVKQNFSLKEMIKAILQEKKAMRVVVLWRSFHSCLAGGTFVEHIAVNTDEKTVDFKQWDFALL